MRAIVLDTNVLLDIFVFEDPQASALKDALLNQKIKAYSSQATIEELGDVISRPLFSLDDKKQTDIVSQWRAISHQLESLKLEAAPWECHDPDDQIFLDMAYTLRPSILISKDNDVLKLASRAAKENVLIASKYDALTL